MGEVLHVDGIGGIRVEVVLGFTCYQECFAGKTDELIGATATARRLPVDGITGQGIHRRSIEGFVVQIVQLVGVRSGNCGLKEGNTIVFS